MIFYKQTNSVSTFSVLDPASLATNIAFHSLVAVSPVQLVPVAASHAARHPDAPHRPRRARLLVANRHLDGVSEAAAVARIAVQALPLPVAVAAGARGRALGPHCPH